MSGPCVSLSSPSLLSRFPPVESVFIGFHPWSRTFGFNRRGQNAEALRSNSRFSRNRTLSLSTAFAAFLYKLGGLGLLWSFFLERSNVQAGYDHAALVVKPHHHPAALGIDGGVVCTGNPITTPAACNNGETARRVWTPENDEQQRSCKQRPRMGRIGASFKRFPAEDSKES